MIERIQKIILQTGNGIVYGLFGAISLYLFLLSIFNTCFMVYTDEHVYYLGEVTILMCIGLVFFCVCLSFVCRLRCKMQLGLSREEKEEQDIKLLKYIGAVLTIMLSIGMIVFIVYMKLPPIYDQGMVYHSAQQLLQGDYTQWQFGEYFSMLPYQNGMVLMMCPFVWIFGDGASIALQLFNVPMLFLTYVGISKISGLYFDRRNRYIVYIGLVMIIPMWTIVTFVYGMIPAICLAIWSIYFEIRFEQTKKWKYIILAGILLFFSIMWKSNSQIFAVVLCLMLGIHGIRTKEWKSLPGIIYIVLCTMLQIKGIPLLMHIITGENTTNGIPMIAWLAMGLQESGIAPGWYNEFPMNLYRKVSTNPEIIKKEVLESFRTSFELFAREKEYAFKFFARKQASMWADPAFQFFTTVNTRNVYGEFSYKMKDFFYNGGVMNTIMYLLLDVLQSIHYFGVVLYFVMKQKKLKLENAHLIVAFLGGFLFHFIGEAKSHYVLSYYMMMVPYVIEGYRTTAYKLANVTWKNKSEYRRIWNSVSAKIGIGLGAIIVLIYIAKGPIVENTLKLGTDTQDYIWYCTNETQWKNDDYYKI